MTKRNFFEISYLHGRDIVMKQSHIDNNYVGRNTF